jgi:hypothetical protein
LGMNDDKLWDLWASWLGEEPKGPTVYKDAVDLQVSRQIWMRYAEIVNMAPDPVRKYHTFHGFFTGSYMRRQGLLIRRQVEVRKDSISLGRLLDRVRRHPRVITRARYLQRLHPTDQRTAHEHFDNLAGPGALALDPGTPREDLLRLRGETGHIRTWVSKGVAHLDPRTGDYEQGLTVGDLHRAVDLVFEVLNRYMQLLRGTTIHQEVVMVPWDTIFRYRWLS